MPKISDILDKQKDKKFTKKEYRPWNLSETLTSENKDAELAPEKPSVQTDIINEPVTIENEKKGQKVVVETVQPEEVSSKALRESATLIPKAEKPNNFVKPDSIQLSVEDHLLQLSGRQKELLILIIRNLVDNKTLVTSPMYSENLVKQISTSLGTIKNAVRRLEGKGLIKSISKRARGGYYRFEATEEVIMIGQRLFFRP